MVAVLYTIKEVAAVAMVVTSPVPVSATRGISKPLFVKSTSKPAEASGVKAVELMPTFCEKTELLSNKTVADNAKKIETLITIYLSWFKIFIFSFRFKKIATYSNNFLKSQQIDRRVLKIHVFYFKKS
jgi:hypothetical protein